MSRNLDDLEPDVRELCVQLLAACAREGINLMVTHTRRTWEEQAQLYARGRTAPGPAVTNAPPGYSWHNFGRAFDVAEKDRTPYDLGTPGPRDDDSIWNRIGDLGESLGLEWGGRWKRPDRPHFEHHGGQTLAAMRASVGPRFA
jgi:peptidoglycan L-alanyl-D-glutamate endopeptidase CwlK